jgi:hypothetical protein
MSRIQEFTDRLSDLLGRTATTRIEFIALAVVGESQRQALALCDEVPPGAAATHAKWLSRLREIANDKSPDTQITFPQLENDLTTAWRELETAAQQHKVDTCRAAFDGVRELMDVATVCVRVAWIGVEQLEALASHAESESRRLTPKLSMLWEYAQQCYTTSLPDPAYPDTQTWLEPIARFSSVRTSLAAASRLFSPQQRQQIVGRVVDQILAARKTAASPTEALDQSGAWATLKAALAPARVRVPARGRGPVSAFVRSYCGKILEGPDLGVLRELVKNLAVVAIPGAGVPVTATSPQVLERELTVGGGIDVDIHIQWTPAGISVTYRVDPPQPGALVLLLEDPATATPLASLAVPADVDGNKECSVATAELGFDPTSRPWHLRVLLA